MKNLLYLLFVCAIALSACARVQPGPPPGPTPSPAPTSCVGPGFDPRPDERWIEVDLEKQVARLYAGCTATAEYAVAAGVGTSPETTTYTGVFKIRQKMKGPIESSPGVYVTDVLVFDIEHGIGFHSVPLDKSGQVLDDTMGVPASAGCVRVGESAAVYDFARMDTRVWVH